MKTWKNCFSQRTPQLYVAHLAKKKEEKKMDFYSDWEAAGTYAGDQAAC